MDYMTFHSKEDLERFIQDQIMTTAEVLEFLEISRARLSTMVLDGKITPIKESGTTRLFLKDDMKMKKEELQKLRKKYYFPRE